MSPHEPHGHVEHDPSAGNVGPPRPGPHDHDGQHPAPRPFVPNEAHGNDAEAVWEELYRERGKAWSGRVNAALAREAAALEPGSALDLGSGEGGDAIWLAQRGWSVTAVDVAPTALARGAADADAAGVSERIRWVHSDLATWQPAETFDLVTSHFLHSPIEFPREAVLRRAAAAVATGGLLLIVGHAAFPSGHEHDTLALPSPDEVLQSLALPPGDWMIVTKAPVERPGSGRPGEPATLVDSVLSLRRL
ncbi:class I SAM-dependent methyltransferase [Subtercola sp. RTI3]|uniref:class I SAM-dependent methyltransferase n=1 Tax=Subtercola sp. RTI3 TaxID=3048639 RepID=UPI002B2239F5|nr:class I SAM-dependent methyltransferase [Subtercola sp. RTI3]MEA9986153.1 class I SAM-dependent methyltransferase [Subtercola sp. RTI3]